MHQAIISRADLKSALALAVKFAGKPCPGEPIDAISHVRLASDAGGMSLAVTDLDIYATIALPGSVADDGMAILLPARKLKEIEAKAPGGDEIGLSVFPEERIGPHSTATETMHPSALDFGRVKIDLSGLPQRDWPELAITGEIKADFTLPVADVLAALQFCETSISQEETRYYLNGVYMHARTGDDGFGYLRFVSTDGHRMGVKDVLCDRAVVERMPESGVIIPTKTVEFLIAAMKRKGAPEHIRIVVNTTKCRFVIGNVDVITKLVDGTFPDYGRVTPTRNERRLTVSTGSLREAIKAAMCVSSPRGRAVKLETFPSGSGDTVRIVVSASNPDVGDAKAECRDAEFASKEPCFAIGFNGDYLLAELDRMERANAHRSNGDVVTFHLADAGSPALITGQFGGANSGTFSVLMPMRV